jgi:YhcH/YjgK/YiaL family protein
MITGQLKDLEKHVGLTDASIILSYIEAVKTNPIIGVWTELSNKLKGLTLDKSCFKQDVFEYHHKYQDIHIVLKGMDQIHLGCPSNKIAINKYVSEGDYALYNTKSIGHINIYPFNFALLYLFELHTNLIEGEDTLKIVIKRIPENG